jgi:hypothetical protein
LHNWLPKAYSINLQAWISDVTGECCGQEDVAHKVAAQLPSALEPVIHELKQHSILTQHGRVERYAIFYRWLVSSCGW